MVRQDEQEVLEHVANKRSRNEWPIANKKAKIFHDDQKLNKLRLLSTPRIRHVPVQIPDKEGKPQRMQCSLCQIRKTRYKCSTCEVPLCTRHEQGHGGPVDPNAQTHFSRWHTTGDLVEEFKTATGEQKERLNK